MLVGDKGFCNYLYQGQSLDEETGLAYNRFRYYSPDTGTYISQDPIGLHSGEFGLYNYVSNPNGWMDVFGLSSKTYAPYGYKKDGTPKKKTGQKTKDEGGPHNDVIGKKAKELQNKGWTITEGGNLEAEQLHITGGLKIRRPDIVATKDSQTKIVNVGKKKLDGSPIKREQQAIDDLGNIFDNVEFVPYN